MKKIVFSVAAALALQTLSMNAMPANADTYTVKKGDTLWNISQKHNVTSSQIRSWNHLTANTIYVGQKLKVDATTPATPSSAGVYVVKKGDTLWGVANTHKVTPAELRSWNQLKSNIIYAGQKLKVGGAASVSSVGTGSVVTVKKGDTLWSLSKTYNVSVTKIKEWNALKSEALSVGQKLVLKETTQTNEKIGYQNQEVTTGSLNVRKEANSQSKVLGTLKKGTVVAVIGTASGGTWVKITFQGQTGYIHNNYVVGTSKKVSGGTSNVPAEPKGYSNQVVTAQWLNVRTGPNASDSKIGTLKKGTVVEVVGTTGGGTWVKINMNGKTGYVHNDYLEATNQPVTVNPVDQQTGSSSAELQGKVIVLDAGHGGADAGAVQNGLYEKTVAFDITNRLKKHLESMGAKVILVRSTDVFIDLGVRADISKKVNADIFVSIHLNSATPSASGTETFYNGYAVRGEINPYVSESRELASEIQEDLLAQIQTRDRKVKSAAFQVLRQNHVPSALVEVAFLSNVKDAAKMKSDSYREKSAIGIAKGIVDYFQ